MSKSPRKGALVPSTSKIIWVVTHTHYTVKRGSIFPQRVTLYPELNLPQQAVITATITKNKASENLPFIHATFPPAPLLGINTPLLVKGKWIKGQQMSS